MAYVRRRVTSSGSFSTALVEAYRDDRGRPRQRLLANMHGEPDVMRALVKAQWRLTALEELIEEHRGMAASDPYAKAHPQRVARYFAELDAKRDVIKREVEVLSAHCTAGDDEMRAAVKERGQAVRDAEAAAKEAFLWSKVFRAELRRLRN
jgi:hypothetical protein